MFGVTPVPVTGGSSDFVFDMDADTRYGVGTTGDTVALLIATGTIERLAGLQRSQQAFDAISTAPTSG